MVGFGRGRRHNRSPSDVYASRSGGPVLVLTRSIPEQSLHRGGKGNVYVHVQASAVSVRPSSRRGLSRTEHGFFTPRPEVRLQVPKC